MKRLTLLGIFALVTSTIFPQDPFCEAIVIQGKSEVKQIPEIIYFSIEFLIEDQDYEKCASRALQKIDSAKSLLKQAGIAEDLIKTSSFSMEEIKERDNRSYVDKHLGYRARVPITIRTEIDDSKSQKIFDIVKSSFQSNVRINFELSERQIIEAKDKLLELAIEDASLKASKLAESLNVKLGRISKIQYGDPQTIREFTRSYSELNQRMELTSAVGQASITSLTPSELSMRTSVMLAWEIVY